MYGSRRVGRGRRWRSQSRLVRSTSHSICELMSPAALSMIADSILSVHTALIGRARESRAQKFQLPHTLVLDSRRLSSGMGRIRGGSLSAWPLDTAREPRTIPTMARLRHQGWVLISAAMVVAIMHQVLSTAAVIHGSTLGSSPGGADPPARKRARGSYIFTVAVTVSVLPRAGDWMHGSKGDKHRAGPNMMVRRHQKPVRASPVWRQ